MSDFREPRPAGKWSQFFGALDRRVSVVGIARPEMATTTRYLTLARSFRRDRKAWLARAAVDPRAQAALDASLTQQLLSRRGDYDLLVQLQTLCTPRTAELDVPYVLYTDSTFALTDRFYPESFPLAPGAIQRRLEFEIDVCRGAQTVYTFSHFAARSMIDDYGCAPERVVAIGAGANQQMDEADRRVGGARRALFVGSPFDRKGGPALLRAWRRVHERLPDAELVLVGPRTDPARGFGRGVSWRGRVDRTELDRLYRSADVFVLPSVFEPWGHVFVEAMAYGLPCIGSDCCAMPELIEEGVSGRLVPPTADGPLAEALVELLCAPDQAAAMGRAGRARVAATLTWDHVADRLITHLSSDGTRAPKVSPPPPITFK